MSATELPEALKRRRNTGFALYIFGQIVGGGLLLMLFLLPALFDAGVCGAMCMGGVLALPACLIYLTVPRLLDRYDPEPWYALLGCLAWGGIAACGFSAAINSTVGICGMVAGGEGAGDVLSAVVSAPLVEEFFKGVGVWGVYYFLRNEFDGVVDGIIYATFTALGFAAVENVIYYAEAAGQGQLGLTFVMRGILFPWGHPVYTSMIGIGLGLARETEKSWVRVMGPIGGYFGAVALHAMWNGSATLADSQGGEVFLCMLPIWFLFVLTFLIIVIVLVRRRGKIMREFLQDEVALRHLSQEEVDLVASAFGLLTARTRWGRTGADFVRATARLALSKWHTHRAHRSQMHTYSMDFIVPLRQRIKELRQQMHHEAQQRR